MTPLTPPRPFDEAKDILVRQSTIGQFQMCGKRVEYADREGYLAPVSEAMAFGQAMHYMVYRDMAGDDPSTLIMDMSWVDDMLREQYEWSLDLVPEPNKFFAELTRTFMSWQREVKPTLRSEVLAMEEDLWMYLGPGRGEDVGIWLRGTPDVVTKSRLIDWKTGNSKWDQNKVDVSIQASLYLALVRYVMGLKLSEFLFWTYYRRSSTWTPYTTTRTVKVMDTALKTAYDYGLVMEAGTYTATPVPETFTKKRGWYCGPKWCGAWNICESKFLGDEVDESIVAIRSWNG